MRYYIEGPTTWCPANRKCKRLQEFVDQFRNCLIADELSRDALVEEIRQRVSMLNEIYPRTKKLVVYFYDDYVCCHPEGSQHGLLGEQNVFAFHIHPVRRTYRFSEQAFLLTEGAEQ